MIITFTERGVTQGGLGSAFREGKHQELSWAEIPNGRMAKARALKDVRLSAY